MNGQDGYLDDLEATPDEGVEGATEGAGETEGGQPAGETKEDWKSAYESLKSQVEDQNLRVLATLNQLVNTPKGETKETPKPQQLTADQWAVAKTMPELIPHLVRSDLAKDWDERFEKFEQRLYQTLGRQNATQNLGKVIRDHYAEEIRDPKSEIMGLAPDVKKMLEPFLRPEVLGTDNHDQLSLLVAAAMKPNAVAKREVARSQAREQARQAAQDRSSSMGEGSNRSSRSAEPQITEEHEAIARRLGVNLKDEKVKARVLKYMKSETLGMYGTRDLSKGAEG